MTDNNNNNRHRTPSVVANMTEKEAQELVGRLRDPKTGVKIKSRKWLFKTYPHVFVGSRLVDWLVKQNVSGSRREAVALGNFLLNKTYFAHCTKDHEFKDEFLFYRFKEDWENYEPEEETTSWGDYLQHLTGPAILEEGSGFQPTLSRSDSFSGQGRLRSATHSPSEDPQIRPLDEHNIRLLDNVRPVQHKDPDPGQGYYNIVVIGAGAAGLVTAAGSAGVGGRVALVERHMLGGDCLNFGCVPSKALLRAARAVHEIKNGGRFGVKVKGEVEVDFAAIMDRMRRLRAKISKNDSVSRFRELGVDIFLGNASFTGKSTIGVNGKTLKFRKAVVASGGRPAVPEIPGLEESGSYYTNETIFNLTQLPTSLAIIGSGAIGCELAQAFARFGSQVTLFSRSSNLLVREDPDASLLLEESLRKDGVRVVHNVMTYCKVSTTGEGRRTRALSVMLVDNTLLEVGVEAILVAIGRKPNVENMGLEVAGVKYDDQKGITVSDTLQTTNGNIFAVGDCCTQYKFTHMADAMARIVIRNALFFGQSRVSALTIPWCTYTEPEIAHVGLYETDALQNGILTRTFTKHFCHNDRAILDGDVHEDEALLDGGGEVGEDQQEGEGGGFVRILVRDGTDEIVGATIVGSRAGEMISEVSLAIAMKIGLGAIGSVIHPYPTQAEAIARCADLYNRTRLTPLVKTLLRKVLSARR